MFNKILRERGYTQTSLAKRIKVSQALVNKWIYGKCQPQLEMIPKLAEALSCSIEEIVNCFKEE